MNKGIVFGIGAAAGAAVTLAIEGIVKLVKKGKDDKKPEKKKKSKYITVPAKKAETEPETVKEPEKAKEEPKK